MSKEKIEHAVASVKLEKSSGFGPGVHLRKAREAKGLSVEEIARKLFLTSKVVKQIENDQYKETLAVTFMRGYLRSYAKLVDLDADVLMTEFNALGLVDAPPLMSTQRIYHRETSIVNRIIPWVSILVGLCVLLLVIMWVHSEFSNNQILASNVGSIGSTVTDVVTENKKAAENSANAVANIKSTNVTDSNSAGNTLENTKTNDLVSNQSAINTTETIQKIGVTPNNSDSIATKMLSSANTAKNNKQEIQADHATKKEFSRKSSVNKENEHVAKSKSKIEAGNKQEIVTPF